MSLEVLSDRSLIRCGRQSVRHLLVTLEAPAAPARLQRPAVNVSFVIDRSGSMSGGKLTRACEAVLHALGRLEPQDRFSVVDYDDVVTVTVPPAFASQAAIEDAARRVSNLHPRQSTNLSGGWLKGCELIAEHLDEENIARCLLLTDGLANCGIKDPEELVGHASALRQRGIATSTFGVGADFDEHLLGAMAERGGGTFHFLSDAEVIPRAIDQELGEALEVVARDACLVIEAPGVEVRSLNDFPTRMDNGRTVIELGGLVSSQVLKIVVELRFPTGDAGTPRRVFVSATDRNEALTATRVEHCFLHALDVENDVQPRQQDVARAVAAVQAARAQREALFLNRRGSLDDAENLLKAYSAKIAARAGGDAELGRIAEQLSHDSRRVSEPMEPLISKAMYSMSISSMKSRSRDSSSMRAHRRRHFALVSTTEAHTQAAGTALASLQASLVALGMDGRSMQIDVGTLGLTSPLGHVQEYGLLRKALANQREQGIAIVLTPYSLRDNWFSHQHRALRAALVSTHTAERFSDVNLAAFIAYETLLHVLQLKSPAYDLDLILHEEERGCLFELCREHHRLAYKLDAMGLCPACRTRLDAWHIDAASVDAASAVVAELQRRANRSVA